MRNNTKPPRRMILAITGASGAGYGVRLLEMLARAERREIHLIISAAGAKILKDECGLRVDLERFRIDALGVRPRARVIYHHYADLAAPPASGSFRAEAMAVVPCSMGCAARLAHGFAGDLIERAGDVMIKEGRKLIIVPRETPFSAVHLENLLALARLGVRVIPACPGFYGKPRRVGDLVDFIVARVLDHLGEPHALGPRWGEDG